MRNPAKNGSALLMVIWTILVLSVLVISFAFEAKLQSSANVYVRERVYMERLVEAGRTLAEMIIATHQSVSDAPTDQNATLTSDTGLTSEEEEGLEKDRWLLEKRQLKKTGSSVTIGPFQLDAGDPEEDKPEVQTGTVTVQIESVGGGEGGGPKFNINSLHPKGNPHYAEIWQGILSWAGVPEDDQEYFVNAWVDWRDDDDVKVGDYGDDIKEGGEKEYYKDYCKNARDRERREKKDADVDDDAEELIYKPRNGPIDDLKELAWLAPFREHDALLKGGVYNPEDREEDWIVVSNITKVLSTFGGDKINVNTASKDVLMCIPGIRSTDDPTDGEDADLIAQAIVDWRQGIDQNGNQVDLNDEENGTLIKDWNKLLEITSGEIKGAAQEYLGFSGGQGDGALYVLTITAESAGMKHVVKAKMTLHESKPVYLEWQEDP